MDLAMKKALVTKTARMIAHRFGSLTKATRIDDIRGLIGTRVGDGRGSTAKGEVTSGILSMAVARAIKKGDFVVCFNYSCPSFPEGEKLAICPNMDEDRCCS